MGSNKPTLVIFDLDGTLTKKDTFVPYLLGLILENPLVIFRSLHLPVAVLLYLLKIRDNSWLKITFLKSILGNKTRASLDRWTSRFVDRVRRNGYRPGALQCLREHKRRGHKIVLATASVDFYVVPLTKGLGFDDVICTQTQWTSEKRFAGRLKQGNCYAENKLARLKSKGYLSGDYHTVAYSDHHSDLLLLKAANTGVAVHPTQALKQVAENNKIEIAYWDQ